MKCTCPYGHTSKEEGRDGAQKAGYEVGVERVPWRSTTKSIKNRLMRIFQGQGNI
jgi:hypothetical protein